MWMWILAGLGAAGLGYYEYVQSEKSPASKATLASFDASMPANLKSQLLQSLPLLTAAQCQTLAAGLLVAPPPGPYPLASALMTAQAQWLLAHPGQAPAGGQSELVASGTPAMPPSALAPPPIQNNTITNALALSPTLLAAALTLGQSQPSHPVAIAAFSLLPLKFGPPAPTALQKAKAYYYSAAAAAAKAQAKLTADTAAQRPQAVLSADYAAYGRAATDAQRAALAVQALGGVLS